MVIPTTSLPIVTALFLIVIGVLIGHLLFFRYESKDKDAGADNDASTRDKSTKRDNALRQTVERQAQEIVALRQARQTLETQWHELKSREENQHAVSLRARHERTEAQENLHQALEAKETTREQLQASQDRVAELEDALETAIGELQTSTAANEMLAAQTQQLESQVSETQGLTDQLHRMTAEYDFLQTQLASAREEVKEYEKRSIESLAERETMLAQLTVERDRRNAAEAKILSVEADMAEAKFEAEQLSVVQEENESATITIANQNSRIAKLTSQLDQLSADGQEQQRTIDKLNAQIDQADKVKPQIEQFSATIMALTAENEALRAAASSQSVEIENTDTRYAKIVRENQAIKEALREAQNNSETIANENSTLHQSLANQKTEIDELRQQLERHRDQLDSLRNMETGLQDELQARNQSMAASARELRSKEARLTDLQRDRDKFAEELRMAKQQFREEKSKANQQIKHLVEQRKLESQRALELESNLKKLEHERQQNDERFQVLSAQLEQSHSTETALEQLQDKLATETECRMMIEVEIEDRNNEISHLRSRLEGFELLQTQNEEFRKSQKTQQKRIENAQKERDEALAAERTTKEIAAELREELQQRLQAVELLEKDKEDAVARLSAEKRAREALHEQLNSDQEELARQHRSLKRKLADREKKVEQFRAEINELRAKKDGQAVQHFISLASFRTGNSGVEGFPEMEKMTFDDSLGPIYRRAPKDRDDLKLIHGIASIMERKLNKLGIYLFQQIMEWDDVAVAEFSKLLSFGDRVQRDNWIGQARRLFREKIDQKAA